MTFKVGDKATVNDGPLKLGGVESSAVHLTTGETVTVIKELDQYGDIRVASESGMQYVDSSCLTLAVVDD